MLQIFGHPFASYYWKVAIAAFERDVAFEFCMVDPAHPDNIKAVERHNPTGQFPVLVDGDRVVIESSAIIEYLDLIVGDASPLVPTDARAAIEARQMDAVFDDYVMGPQQRMVFNVLRPEDQRDPLAHAEAQAALDKAYAWLDRWMSERVWAANDAFSIADCSAAPALFYAHWSHPIPDERVALLEYRARLLERPSIARVVEDARPYREFFPLKAYDPEGRPTA